MIFKIRTTDSNNAKRLAKELDIDCQIASLLYQRGIETVEQAKAFLCPDEDMLLPPDIINIDKAVIRIKEAIASCEKILLFGDYDCDGICSVAMLKLFLESIGANVEYYIPSRESGYGLSIEALEKVAEMHLPDLIITVDCGISAYEEVLYCYEVLGIDIIITDHHEPSEEIPDCIVVNPKLDINSKLKNLCGAGVVLKLIEAYGGRAEALQYIDIASIATIADVVPLIGENRVITSLGLKKLNRFERMGLKMLIQSIGLDQVNSADVGYKIAPRLNAPGRMGCKSDIMPLFCSCEYFELECIVKELNTENEKRQRESNIVYQKALEKVKELRLEELSIIVLHSIEWDSGMLGLVASRLTADFYRPVIMINAKNEFCRGSARSVDGINIYECLSNVAEYLEQFGGHEGAAGFTINIAKINSFTKAIDCYIKSRYSDKLLTQSLEYDIEVKSSDMIDNAFCKNIELFEPTGDGNRPPLFLFDSSLLNLSRLCNTNHIKFKHNKYSEGVIFNSLDILKGYNAGAKYQFLTTLSRKKYKNTDYINIAINCSNILDIEDISDTAEGLYLYLKTILYENRAINAQFIPPAKAYEEAECKGAVVVAFSSKSGKEFINNYKDSIELSIGKLPKNPINRILICPDAADYSYYRKAILLDAPLSTGYIDMLQKSAPETEFLIVAKYGFDTIIKDIDISEDAIINTQNMLYNYLNIISGVDTMTKIYEGLQQFGYSTDEYSFIAHFLALYDYNIINNGLSGGFIVYKNRFDIEKSRVINTIKKLKVQL